MAARSLPKVGTKAGPRAAGARVGRSGQVGSPGPSGSAAGNRRRAPKKSEQIARQLANELTSNKVKSGTLIDVEGDLMKRLGTSRATLREGLRLLEVLGVVESRIGRNGGVVVQRPQAPDFAHIVTFYLQFTDTTYRQLVEANAEISPIVAGIAAREATSLDRAALEDLMTEFAGLDTAQKMRSIPRITELIIQTLPNPIWQLFAESIHLVVRRRLDQLLVPEPMWPAAIDNAVKLAAAVGRGDQVAAARYARAQSQGWLDIANRYQPDLLDSLIVWD